ncbi:hypothetical protein KY290_015504 [Solanum tuberosum]|uniref:Uncharacterized protein n=1 Tax=Solanum tuberosum TaxID=4113 RepID=A0ABQ7VUK6_SOLTU|nr:hypothetical protein KY289_015094 [Solanum tuberosum]KAH0700643.1 hypothetical protein KY284_014858 [Solanum tuberosum]KAH0718849.1 hypothetical protein KY285_014880 [Solanum tuberosum]KAH0771523.1 hypothetical protein KY290_015504 [Solanum tuberosum]
MASLLLFPQLEIPPNKLNIHSFVLLVRFQHLAILVVVKAGFALSYVSSGVGSAPKLLCLSGPAPKLLYLSGSSGFPAGF